MTKIFSFFALVCATFWLTACSGEDGEAPFTAPIPWVKTIQVSVDNQLILELSGVVRARFETPVAFELSGRIASRHINAGQHVEKGQALFGLDTRDLKQTIHATEAGVAAAQAALTTATADVMRDRQLVAEKFVSRQALERTELVEREAKTRLNAAQAQLQQARNALNYADLRAEEAGVLIEVSGEPNQVVTFGQAIAVLARDGKREVEVFFPENTQPHQTGSIRLADGSLHALKLRESAGAAHLSSRTWRARYRIVKADHALSLGQVVRTRFMKSAGEPNTLKIPLGALDERGEGVRIWQLLNNQAQPVPAQIIALDTEHAWITADLQESSCIIVLGTNQLKPGMTVQALTR